MKRFFQTLSYLLIAPLIVIITIMLAFSAGKFVESRRVIRDLWGEYFKLLGISRTAIVRRVEAFYDWLFDGLMWLPTSWAAVIMMALSFALATALYVIFFIILP